MRKTFINDCAFTSEIKKICHVDGIQNVDAKELTKYYNK